MSEVERKKDPPERPAPERRGEEGERPAFRPADELLKGTARDTGHTEKHVKDFPRLEANGPEVKFHEHGWAKKAPDGAVTVEVKVGDPAEARLHFERYLGAARDSVPPGYEAAHAVGRNLGVESPYGIAFAPREVNQQFQKNGIEARVQELQAAKPKDVDLYLRAEVRTCERGLLLREINYELYAQPAGSERGEHRTRLLEASVNCPKEPNGPVGIEARVTNPEALAELLRRGADERRREK